MKILVKYETCHDSHDCWGKYESYYTTTTEEFDSMDHWLRFKSKNPNVSFIEAWEIGKHIK